MLETRRELQEFELAQQSLFDQTAEVRAKNQAIMWWLLSLGFFEEDGKDLPVFGEGDYEDRLVRYDEYEDLDDPFWNEAVKKLAFFVSFWESGQAASREDFDEIAKKLEPKKEGEEEKEETPEKEELKTAYEKAEEQEQEEEKEAKEKAKPKAKRKKKAPEKEEAAAA